MQLDAARLTFPLLLRPWRKGDYMSPAGMHMKKKKVSDILVDKKISSAQKGNVYVVQSGEKLAGVLGIRTDERFKIGPDTQRIFKISIQKGQ
jgi:tRNA(Ile)-lysidine synthase